MTGMNSSHEVKNSRVRPVSFLQSDGEYYVQRMGEDRQRAVAKISSKHLYRLKKADGSNSVE
jgi:hypothetical protein